MKRLLEDKMTNNNNKSNDNKTFDNRNNHNKRYDNRKYVKTYYDIVVFDEDSRRKFFHKGLKKWEVEAIKFNPHLKVKIVDKRVIDKSDRNK